MAYKPTAMGACTMATGWMVSDTAVAGSMIEMARSSMMESGRGASGRGVHVWLVGLIGVSRSVRCEYRRVVCERFTTLY